MKPDFNGKQAEIAKICHRYGVRRMEAFDATDTMLNTSTDPVEMGFVIDLENEQDIGGYELLNLLLDMEKNLGELLQCPVHVSRREVIEENPNYLFRQHVLDIMESVYG